MSALTGNILIVDDERSMREFLAIFLRRAGHRVEAAAGGSEGLATLRAREFDVVLTDLRMPEVGGLEILAETKKLYPETQVIVVTAFATTETAISSVERA